MKNKNRIISAPILACDFEQVLDAQKSFNDIINHQFLTSSICSAKLFQSKVHNQYNLRLILLYQ